MKLYNTMERSVVPFTPLKGPHVGLYTCGPTVYNYAHIGNYRAYIFEDILRRVLTFAGYDVTQVMNLTDVDDKTIRGAREAGLSLDDYTRTYKEAFFEDLKTLRIEPAEHYPAATEHVPEMIALIERLFENGVAYRSDDGSIYFNVGAYDAYGKLARLDISGLLSGARVAQDEYEKDNVADFALWKAWGEDDGDVVWDSPWGRGRPGWHIECSAMSMKYLGESFDIHTGGVDNLFPHHENEIAQAQAATGKPFVQTWLHCEHLRVNGKKMAKSLGNFFTLRDLIEKGYTGREIRYLLLSAHYRQELNFTLSALDGARTALGRLDEFRARLGERAAGDAAGEAPAWAAAGRDGFRQGVEEDLGLPQALAALFDMVHQGNRALDAGGVDAPAAAGALAVLDAMDTVLGLKPDTAGDGPDEAVQTLLNERAAAREAKQWADSDRLRDALAGMGWEVRDTPEGQKLRCLS
ncbi:MAG: cysteine--tRNA ligase [Verrucomicrobia bacterium]|jgi:cysteinyl-tRNA synthetase|nr:cysteine--tRNA ligase [Verrucomicrobiota bacterium]MBT7066238.1 cysteine--tRNA ligase [Verrucomicrobiota bacterium]MBT7700377.1 cysteine--tRNA ligase [Verrucomicrobiota bacterium]